MKKFQSAAFVAILALFAGIASSNIYLSYFDSFIYPITYISGIIEKVSQLAYLATDPAAASIYREYSSFKNSYVRPKIIIPERSAQEKALIAYHSMMNSGLDLSADQIEKYQDYLKLRAKDIETEWTQLIQSTLTCSDQFMRSQKSAFRSIKSSFERGSSVSSKLVNLQKFSRSFAKDVKDPVQKELLVKSCVSKTLILAMDNASWSKKEIVFLIPVHKEFNRLKKPSESPMGEDFLMTKYRELEALFKNTKKLRWSLTFVDDQPINESPSTADAIRSMVEDFANNLDKSRIKVLTYRDLKKEVEMFGFEHIPKDVNKFAKESRKGGAVYAALRKLSLGKSAPDAIIFTDADTSTSLLQSGLLLEPLYPFKPKEGHASVAIGSRRSPGSLMVRNEQRNIMSVAYNMLTRVLYKLDISDTQMGFKAILPEVVRKTHPAFSDIGMAFDVELLWLANTQGFKIKEVPCVWVDSDLESQSADQGMPMFQELWEVFGRRSEQLKKLGRKVPDIVPLPLPSAKNFSTVLISKFVKSREHEEILQLGANSKFAFIVREFNRLYTVISPQAFKDFVDSCSLLFDNLAKKQVSRENIQRLINSIRELLESDRDYELLFKFIGVKLFPEIGAVVRTLAEDHELIRIVLPLLTGDNILTSLLHMQCPSFRDYLGGSTGKKSNWFSSQWKQFKAWIKRVFRHMTTATKQLTKWMKLCNKKQKVEDTKFEYSPSTRDNRIGHALRSLRLLPETDVYVTTFVSPNDERDASKFIKAKIDDLAKYDKGLRIRWHFLIATSRNQPFDKHSTYGKGSYQYFKVSKEDGKASATRKVFSSLTDSAVGSRMAYLAYIDLSQKIKMSEMLVLLEKCTSNGNADCVSIGSRRLPESRVSDKPVSFLARSTLYNWIVKVMFPNLFSLTDTQTGFKLFSVGAWKRIQTAEPPLKSVSLAFDVEILQQASRNGLTIHESPVDFADNTLANEGDVASDDAGNMFEDLIDIRGRLSDAVSRRAALAEATFFSAGAESIVYRLSDDTLLKIPHERADPDFAGWLKYFVFKDREALTIDDQTSTVLASPGFSRIMNNPRIKNLIPAIRQWKEFNAFVMKIIAAYENKNYKSSAYSTVWSVGKDLVVPYRIITRPFAVQIDGKRRTFDLEDDVKQVKMSKLLFNDAFKIAVNANDVSKAKALICMAVSTTMKLWKRGLFDLDTNFMVDMGFYPVDDANGLDRELLNALKDVKNHGTLSKCLNSNVRTELTQIFNDRFGTSSIELMVIDPGELVNDKKHLKIQVARNKLPGRYDFLEMLAMLEGKKFKSEIEKFYLDHMNALFDLLEGDFNESFGLDIRMRKDVSTTWTHSAGTPFQHVDLVSQNARRRLESLKLAKVGYQTPLMSYNAPPLKFKTLPFVVPTAHHAVPLGLDVAEEELAENSAILRVRPGSIEPVLHSLNFQGLLQMDLRRSYATFVLLDGGSATRSGIIKYANKPQTKGNIFIHGKPLCHHIHDNLLNLIGALSNDYLVLSSCDDLLSYDREYLKGLAKSIKREKTAFFWFDNDNPSDNPPFPMTTKDMISYVEDHIVTKGEADRIASQIPPLKGPRKAGYINDVVEIAKMFYQEASNQQTTGTATTQDSGASPLGPVMPMVSDYLRTWLSYNSMIDSTGPKTPFLFILRKDFARDLLALMKERFKDYQYIDMTWESTVVRAFKSDRTFWGMNKPSEVDSKSWNLFYDDMQRLKERYGVLTRVDMLKNRLAAQKMSQRIFPLNWNNFDDGYSIYTYFEKNYRDRQFSKNLASSVEIAGVGPVDHNLLVISDHNVRKSVRVVFHNDFAAPTAILKQRLTGMISLVGCRDIPDVIHVSMDPAEPFWKPGQKVMILIYNLHQFNSTQIKVANNNMLVEIADNWFMTGFLPAKKEDLKKRPIMMISPQTRDEKVLNGIREFKKIIGDVSARKSTDKPQLFKGKARKTYIKVRKFFKNFAEGWSSDSSDDER